MRIIKKQLEKSDKKEKRLLSKKQGPIGKNIKTGLDKLQEKIPPKLKGMIYVLFEKAFHGVFEKGTGMIEKTYQKESIQEQYHRLDEMVDRKKNTRSIKNMDMNAKRSRFFGRGIAFIEGGGLGLLGIGLPDIPIFTAVLLRGIYEIATGYGYNYNRYEEKLYILKLIQAALGDEKDEKNRELDAFARAVDRGNWHGSLEEEIKKTSEVLAEELLVAKFIQGLPLVGVLGAAFNQSLYKRLSYFAALKYKKRYLEKKLNEEKTKTEKSKRKGNIFEGKITENQKI